MLVQINATVKENAPPFQSAICADCDSAVSSFFRQPNQTFLCSRCVRHAKEKLRLTTAIEKAYDILKFELDKGSGQHTSKINLRGAGIYLERALRGDN